VSVAPRVGSVVGEGIEGVVVVGVVVDGVLGFVMGMGSTL
jgi:hypothetical protein